jgi:hypothetical protein
MPGFAQLFPTSRRLLVSIFVTLASLLIAEAGGRPTEKTVTITEGDLKVVFRDQVKSLSGVASLVHLKDAPDWNALNPGRDGGLNFEHIISGHKNPHNKFTPRKGKLTLSALPDAKSVRLVRNKEDEPWAMSSAITYTVVKPHYIDMDFRCVAHDKSLFGKRGYAILFFADYMNNVEDVALNFRGVEGPKGQEKWIKADASQVRGKTIPDYDTGGTYRSLPAAALEYDADHNFKLNSWSYDYPRFTKPFYFGTAGKGMVFMLMFNKMHNEADEIRFSLFKFFVRPKDPRPAWDFQYVIHKVEEKREYGFKARLVWKKFVSPEDCLKEYETWSKSLEK